MPRIPPKVPRKPWRSALVRVMTTPGPGLSTVVAAISRKMGYNEIMRAPGKALGSAVSGYDGRLGRSVTATVSGSGGDLQPIAERRRSSGQHLDEPPQVRRRLAVQDHRVPLPGEPRPAEPHRRKGARVEVGLHRPPRQDRHPDTRLGHLDDRLGELNAGNPGGGDAVLGEEVAHDRGDAGRQ